MGLAAVGAIFGQFAGKAVENGPELINGLTAGYALASLMVLAGFVVALKWMQSGRPEHR